MSEYLWERPFRLRILAACLHKVWYASVGASVIKPAYFNTKEEKDLVRFLAEFYQSYKRAPVQDEIVAEFNNCDELMAELIGDVLDLLDTQPGELDYAKSKAIEFARMQECGLAILKGAELRDQGRLDEIEPLFREALRVGQDVQDMGLDLVKDADSWIYPEYTEDAERICTGLNHADMAMAGGIGRGEYWLVVGPPGSGKTRTLVNFGIGAASLISRANVLHVTLEMSAKKVARRYGARLVGEGVVRGEENVFKQEFTLRSANSLRGIIKIKQYPNKRLTITELQRYLDSLDVEGFHPDVIIIDYPTNMSHNPKLEYRHQLADTTEEIRAIAVERNTGVWGAAQTTRAALYKEIIDMDDVAECWDMIATADGVFTVCQTKAENVENMMRLFNAKFRDEASKWMVRCKLDPTSHAMESIEHLTYAEYLQSKEANNGKSLPIERSLV